MIQSEVLLNLSLLAVRAGRGLPGGKSLSLASPRESNQREGDPTVWGLLGSDTNFTAARSTAPFGRAKGSVNLGSDPKNPPCGAQSSRGLVQTRFAQTSTSPYPSGLALLSAARRGWGDECGFGFGFSPHPRPLPEGRGSYSGKPFPRMTRLSLAPALVFVFFIKPVLAGLRSAGGDG